MTILVSLGRGGVVERAEVRRRPEGRGGVDVSQENQVRRIDGGGVSNWCGLRSLIDVNLPCGVSGSKLGSSNIPHDQVGTEDEYPDADDGTDGGTSDVSRVTAPAVFEDGDR